MRYIIKNLNKRTIAAYTAFFVVEVIALLMYLSLMNSMELHGNEIADLYDSETDRKLFSVICAVMCALLGGTGLSIPVANAFLENSKRKNKLYLFKCAGLSNNDYLKLTFKQTIISILFSMLIGIPVGTLGAFLSVKVIGKYWIDWLRLSFSPCAMTIMLLLCILLLFTGSVFSCIKHCSCFPVKLIHQVTDKTSAYVFGQKAFSKHPAFVRAARNVINNSTGYLSPVMATVAVIVTSSVVWTAFAGLNEYFKETMRFDYEINTNDGSFFSLLSIPERYDSFSKEEVSSFDNTGDVSKCYAISSNTMFIVGKTEDIIIPTTIASDLEAENSYSADALARYKGQCKQFGYGQNERLYKFTLWGVNDALWQRLTGELPSGSKDELLILSTGNIETMLNPGDELAVSAPRFSVEGNITRVDFSLSVGKIIDFDESPDASAFFDSTVCRLVVPYSLIESELGNGYNKILLETNAQEDTGSVESLILALTESHKNDPQFSVLSRREENLERNRLKAALSVIVINVTAILFVSLFSSLIITVRSDLYGKRRIWGYLRSQSMSEKQGFLSELSTMLLCVLTGVIFAAAVFGIAAAAAPAEIGELMPFWSWQAVVIPVSLIIFVVTLVTFISVRRFWRIPVVKLLQTE